MSSDERDQRPVFGDRNKDKPQSPFGSYRRREPRKATDPYTDVDDRPDPEFPELVELPEDALPPDAPYILDPPDDTEAVDPPPLEEDEAEDWEFSLKPRSVIDEVAESIPLEEEDFLDEEDEAQEEEDAPEPQRPKRKKQLKPLIMLRTLVVMVATGGLVATMLTWWTPNAFLPAESIEQLSVAQATQVGVEMTPASLAEIEAEVAPQIDAPTPTFPPPPPPELNRVGIVAGHTGIYPPTGLPDPGAVCDDGLTEREINVTVAARTAELLRGHGYEVNILEEFDERLTGYRALAMVSIHADSCANFGEGATGYKVASFAYSANPDEDDKLVRCLSERYEETTRLPFHPSITFDMTEYHNFREIDPSTPGAIIEIGFMYTDRQILTEEPEVVALGIARGVLCYLRNELPVTTVDEP